MKITPVAGASLPGAFVVVAESEAEILLLRSFANWPGQHANPQELVITNHGGNIGEGRYSFMFQWGERRKDPSEPKPLSYLTGWFARREQEHGPEKSYDIAVVGLHKHPTTLTLPLDSVPEHARVTGHELILIVCESRDPTGGAAGDGPDG